MAEDRKSEHGDRLHNRADSLCDHQRKFLDDILALDQINFLNECRRKSQILGGRSFGSHENRISSVSQAGGCEKLPKGVEEERGPKTTTASAHAPPPGTTRKNQSSASKEKKISSSLTSLVSQAGGCEKLPKAMDEDEIMPNGDCSAAPPSGTTTKTRSSASKQKKIRKY
jgi:hypothetical protein